MRTEKRFSEFQWDKGNTGKNRKHGVLDSESEEVFFDENKVMLKDVLHSGNESRFILLGKTKKGRLLFVVFAKRGAKIRIISARDINKKEKYLYEEKT
ncbi:MAG: BrnT family toxin [bacterium]|nr:BrnT family toxin [bacterium]